MIFAFWFAAGLLLLLGGAEILVRGATRLATAAGISPLVIGLTIVAFGTSAPELAVSIGAAVQGDAGIAIGNVVGSNICNILFILGISAAITPLAIHAQLVRFDVWVMITLSGLTWLMAAGGVITRWEGLVLVTGAVLYTVWLLRQNRSATTETPELASTNAASRLGARAILRNLGLVVAGLALLLLGGRWLVLAAVDTARALNVSEVIIGLTIVAVGTSLPEVATSVIAALRGQRDMAVGNVVGSNIFNILAVLGLTATAAPDGIAVGAATLSFDLPVMLVTAMMCLPIFFTGYRIDRWEGSLLLLGYVAYLVYLTLDASRSAALPWYRWGVIGFGVPLVLIVLIAAVRQRRAAT